MKAICAFAAGLLAAAGGLAAGPDPSFTSAPVATRDGQSVRIAFTLSAASDVEVAVLGANGRVVCHLAAGVLGGDNPPSAPLVAGLAQKLTWDGKDDAGQPAAGGPFSVRVRAGMNPRLGGYLLEQRSATGPIKALAVGPKGSLYVFHADATTGAGHWGSTKVKVLDREGKYLRTVMPFAADIDPAKIKPLGPFQDEQGRLVPRIHHMLRLSFYPAPVWQSPGQSPAVDANGRVYWIVRGPAIACLDGDGGVPYDRLIGPDLLGEIKGLTMASQWFYAKSRPCLALSEDGKRLYFAGLNTGNPDHKEAITPVPCVFRVDAATRDKAEVFLGKLDTPGVEKDLLTDPRGLALAGGLLYVADFAADRVTVFKESDRSFVGQIAVKAPDTIGVDPSSGAVYVCSLRDPATPDLIKFENYRSGRELYRLALPTYKFAKEGGRPHRIVVDASAAPVRIWVPTIPYTPHQLLCIDDAGDKFVARGDPRGGDPVAEGPRDLSYDRTRDELYVKVNYQQWYRLDEKGDRPPVLLKPSITYRPEAGSQLVPDPDGNLATYSWSGAFGLRRFDHDAKPLNWPGLSTNYIPLPGQMCYQIHHLLVPNRDELYIIPPGDWRKGSSNPSSADEPTTCLNVYGADGQVRRTLIWQCTKGAIPRLDARGNIYLAEMVKPPDRAWPEFFDGKFPPPPAKTNQQDSSYYYSYMYGSIVKFPPTGGAIWYGKKGLGAGVVGEPPADLLAKPRVPIRIHAGHTTQETGALQGALWQRFGFAPFTCTKDSCMLTCMCEGGGFDVDPYGRIFFPDLGRFRVQVIDTNNNPITTFGRYGNADFTGDDKAAGPGGIPLAWPLTVAVSDAHAYVADTLNRRVVRVDLDYAAEATCGVPQGVMP
ncbi:MAG: hypothetical protein BIFFINMI_00708 [Phycisphaerae bacterium]|nr:hypothetical protein [Phycisphaerae bacterium]